MGQIIAAFLAVTFLFVGCSGDGVLDSSEEPLAIAAKRGGQSKVEICHRDAESGTYQLIRLAAPALSAHLAHGDEIPGVGLVDENCEARPPDQLTVTLPGGATMELAYISPGTFLLGTPEDETVGVGTSWPPQEREKPQHAVTLTRGFYISVFEVTQRQWVSVMDTEPWRTGPAAGISPNHPATHITWSAANEFVDALNLAVGDALYRLPTEAEWEYACRAGSTTGFFFGTDPALYTDYAWYFYNTSAPETPQPVGQKLPNPWGLFDVYGNVWEWCLDTLADYPSAPQVDPLVIVSGAPRILRGASTANTPVRSAWRAYAEESRFDMHIGFRLAREGT